jgi:dipeptidase
MPATRRVWIVVLVWSLLLCWVSAPLLACYAVVVGRAASADGSVLVGHNEENGGQRVLHFHKIPRRQHPPGARVDLQFGGQFDEAPETWAFLWSENPGLAYSDGYLNEWGVAIASDGCRSREDGYDALVARGEIRDGGIGYMLRRLVAQRAKTAREGMELIGQLVERFGYADSGRTYVVADRREAWLVAVVRGRRWVAQRVPDDKVVILPNVYIIGEVDLDDTANFRASPDLVSYAAARGWFEPERERFSFRKAYQSPERLAPDRRQFRGQEMATGGTWTWPPAEPLPFAVTAHKKTRRGRRGRHFAQPGRDRAPVWPRDPGSGRVSASRPSARRDRLHLLAHGLPARHQPAGALVRGNHRHAGGLRAAGRARHAAFTRAPLPSAGGHVRSRSAPGLVEVPGFGRPGG